VDRERRDSIEHDGEHLDEVDLNTIEDSLAALNRDITSHLEAIKILAKGQDDPPSSDGIGKDIEHVRVQIGQLHGLANLLHSGALVNIRRVAIVG
jgi:hypothetical protein